MDTPTDDSMSVPINELAGRINNNPAPNNPNPIPNANPQPDNQPVPNSEHIPTPPQPRSRDTAQTNSMSSNTSANSNTSMQDVILSKQLQAMMLETAKQQVQVDNSPLDANHRFTDPSDFLQFSLFTSAIRERIRGRVWNAKFEAWITSQLSLEVEQMYTNMIQTIPIKNDYQPMPGFYSVGVRFAGSDDFEHKMYNYYFGTEQMQCRVLKAVSNFHVGNAANYNNEEATCFDNCTSLCNVAIRAFDLLNINPLLIVPQMIQASLVTNQLPKYAITKLKEWHPDVVTRPHDMTSMMMFVKRVDDSFDKKAKPRGILKISTQLVSVRGRAATPHPRGKRHRSRSRFQASMSRSQSPMPRSRSRSPMMYRSQSHYKGSCAKCGKIGHSIAQCRFATDEEKNTFFQKVKETKANANANGKKPSKTNNKKVRYANDTKTYDGPDKDKH